MSSRVSRWDLCLFRRALTVGGLGALVTLLVIAATDGGASWRSRLGMTSALAPLAGALGTLLALRTAADRGELRALAAVGVHPSRAGAGATLGGAALGAVSALSAASPLADLASLFPRGGAVWVIDDQRARELTTGLRVLRDGSLSFEPATGAPAAPVSFAVAVIAIAAVAGPAWVSATSMSVARRARVGVVLLVAAIVAFQLVAAQRAPAILLIVSPLAMLADAVGAHRRPSSS